VEAAAEQRGRGGEDPEREQRSEGEQAHARGCDLGDGTEADHRPVSPR
jgi:hypothetical protein